MLEYVAIKEKYRYWEGGNPFVPELHWGINSHSSSWFHIVRHLSDRISHLIFHSHLVLRTTLYKQKREVTADMRTSEDNESDQIDFYLHVIGKGERTDRIIIIACYYQGRRWDISTLPPNYCAISIHAWITDTSVTVSTGSSEFVTLMRNTLRSNDSAETIQLELLRPSMRRSTRSEKREDTAKARRQETISHSVGSQSAPSLRVIVAPHSKWSHAAQSNRECFWSAGDFTLIEKFFI